MLKSKYGGSSLWLFWGFVVVTLLIYTVFPFWFRLRPYYLWVPSPDIRSFSASLPAGAIYACLFGLLYFIYWRAFRQVAAGVVMFRPEHLLLITILFGLPLLFTFPINATDIFSYLIRGRIMVVYGQSPFLAAPQAFPQDPYWLLAGEWANTTSPYGPVWELLGGAIAWLSGGGLLRGLLLFKLLGLILHLAIGKLIWLSLSHLPAAGRSARLLLWLWNPALLLIFVVDAHNDALMIFWLLLGYWLMQGRQPILGWLVMVMAPLSKLIALLLLPFFWLRMWRAAGSGRDKIRFFLLSLGGGLFLTLFTFAPFGSPLELIQRLLAEASDNGGFSPLTLLILSLQRLKISLSIDSLVQWGLLFFTIIALWLLWSHKKAEWGVKNILMAYLATGFTFRIWYPAWLFPWLLVDEAGRHVPAGATFLLTAQLSVLIYGHLRVYLLHRDQLQAHLLGVPFTFLLPLFVAWRTRPQNTPPTN